MTYFSLALATIPVLVFLAAQDLKERMIYSFPVLFLSGAWAAHSVILYKDNPIFVITAWSATIALFAAYKISGMWGDGDSDMWLLFTGVIQVNLRAFKNLERYGSVGVVCQERAATGLAYVLYHAAYADGAVQLTAEPVCKLLAVKLVKVFLAAAQ